MFKKLKGVLTSQGLTGATSRDQLPRTARIVIQPLSGVCFSVVSIGGGQIDLEVVNLSEKGIGLCNAPVLKMPPPGSILNGELVLSRHRLPASLKLVHVSEATIGGAFVGDSVELQKEIQRHFQVETSAVNLVEITAKRLKEEPDGVPRLFRGRNNCELFLIERGAEVARFQLSFFGNFIEGAPGAETKCGFLTMEGGVPRVRFVPELSSDVLKAATTFLTHIPDLKAEHRAQIQETIESLTA